MRFWPRSLLGQVLLSVAAALLVAQAISAHLLFRASEDRREQRMVGSLAVQLIAAANQSQEQRAKLVPQQRVYVLGLGIDRRILLHSGDNLADRMKVRSRQR